MNIVERLKDSLEYEYNLSFSERKQLLGEIERLNNIISELEKWCNECIDYHIIARENGDTTISDTFFEIVLNKIKELKENK